MPPQKKNNLTMTRMHAEPYPSCSSGRCSGSGSAATRLVAARRRVRKTGTSSMTLTHNSPTCITLQFAASEAARRWVRKLVSSIVASSINAAARNLLSCIGVYCALRKDVELYIHTSSSCSSLLRFFNVCWYLQWRMQILFGTIHCDVTM